MSFVGSDRGPIAWMARNGVAANLLMLSLIFGGLFLGSRVKQEVFPEFELEIISITVPYPGASPEEVEQGIVLAIEEAVRGVNGLKKITSSSNEGAGNVLVELLLGADPDQVLADVKSAVDRITSFPEDAERAIVNQIAIRRRVISVLVHGDVEEKVLQSVAERARDDLLQNERITYVDLLGTRPLEIGIEVPQANLRSYGLTIPQIAQTIRVASVELPGGAVKTSSGELLLRTAERRDAASEFEDIVVRTSRDGTELTVGQIARVVDGYRDVEGGVTYNGERAIAIDVYRVGDQTPIELADIVRTYVAENRVHLPPGIGFAVWSDQSSVYRQRMSLLIDNGYLGLVLVLLILGLFLEVRLAFWVTLGIPISICGALLLLPAMDASINMISLMAFIVTLGLVVDDAIVVGENIYARRQSGESPIKAAIWGAQEVGVPVVFSVLTTVAAFAPLLFITGVMGKFMWVIPAVVITVLLVSLVESLFILPAHLAHTKAEPSNRIVLAIDAKQARFSAMLDRFVQRVYKPALLASNEHRYLTIATLLAMLLVAAGIVAGGRIDITFLPELDADAVSADAVLPFGSPVKQTIAVRDRLTEAAAEALEEITGSASSHHGVYSRIGAGVGRGSRAPSRVTASHLGGVAIQLAPTAERDFTAGELVTVWRRKLGEMPGVKTIDFRYQTGPGGGAAIQLQLSHPDLAELEKAAQEAAVLLASFDGVADIDNGFDTGKPQLDFRLKPAARTLQITESSLARQVRSSFFGAEALRQQRGRNEVRVMVRLPEGERRSEGDVEALLIRSPGGGEIAIGEAADVSRGSSYTSIQRVDGRRVVTVSANIIRGKASPPKIIAKMRDELLPELASSYRGLAYSFEGRQASRAESLDSMASGFMVALVVIFALLAIPFGSYVQPLIIMAAIPFGFIGAIGGHLLMGYDLSLISMMGIVALAGVTVNDSLVLIVAVNRLRESGLGAADSVVQGGLRRFRPIVLTSVTTFFGLAPMIFETSTQARFLIPMAISLGFGIMFATLVILFLVPALYLALEDAKRLLGVEDSEAPHDAPSSEPALHG